MPDTIQKLAEELSRRITLASARGEITAADQRALTELMSNLLTATPAPSWLEPYLPVR